MTMQQPWDEEVYGKASGSRLRLLAEDVESKDLCLPRCVRPDTAMGQPIIVGFCDGAWCLLLLHLYKV